MSHTIYRSSMEATFRIADAELGSLTTFDGLPFTPTMIGVREYGGQVRVYADGPCVRKDGTPGTVHRQALWQWRKDPMPAWIVDAIHEIADFMAGAAT